MFQIGVNNPHILVFLGNFSSWRALNLVPWEFTWRRSTTFFCWPRDPFFIKTIDFTTEVDPMSIIFNEIQYLTIFLIVDLQENIFKEVEKIDYPSAGFAGRRIVDFKDLNIDIFLEVHNQKYS